MRQPHPKSVGKEGDLVVKDLGNKVHNPSYYADTGNEGDDACYEGNGVLRLNVSEDSVNASYNRAEEDLNKDLSDLGEILVSLSKSCRCHWFVLLCYVFTT